MISLVLATYNGEKYIIDQLESIINQSLQPDEVIIRDDCSTDATQSIIFDFIERNKLKWKFVPAVVQVTGQKKNKENLKHI